jgi:hypothetical protein
VIWRRLAILVGALALAAWIGWVLSQALVVAGRMLAG